VGVLPNEAVHIASVCHLAGFRHVVGTLWSVSDRVSVDLTASFYAAVTTDGVPDSGRCAEALHHVVRDLRRRWRNHPSVWAAYVHVGG
jgi:CHAT domain-containing protein